MVLFDRARKATKNQKSSASKARWECLGRSPEAVKNRMAWWRTTIVKLILSDRRATEIELMIEVLGEQAYYQCFAAPKKFLPKTGKPSSSKSRPTHGDENVPRVLWNKKANTWTVPGEMLKRSRRDWQKEPEDCTHPVHLWKLGGNSAASHSTKGKWWTCTMCGSRYERLPSQSDRLKDTDRMILGKYTDLTYAEVLSQY